VALPEAVGDALARFVSDGLITAHVATEDDPPSPYPRVPVLPGLPPIRAPRLSGLPDVGERFYRPTQRGLRLARLSQQAEGALGPFVLGPERVRDQVLWVVGKNQHTSPDEIDLECGTVDADALADASMELERDKMIRRDPISFVLDTTGAPRFREVHEEIQQLWRGLPPQGPDPKVARGYHFDSRSLHRVVAAAARDRFVNVYLDEAVNSACSQLFAIIRARLGADGLAATGLKSDSEGSNLVTSIMKEPPAFTFGDRNTETGRSIHDGAKHLLISIPLLLRNGAAHLRGATTDDVEVLERLACISLAVRLVEGATVTLREAR